jgi:malonate-semialdehyde dehydrogenase (acetylating)/methylmalonate-semialdehyde dehydrogenase
MFLSKGTGATAFGKILSRPVQASLGIRYNGIHRTATVLTSGDRSSRDQLGRPFSSTPATSASAVVAQPWVVDSKYQYYRNGQFVPSAGPAPFEVRDPATQELVGAVPEMTEAEFDEAVALARDAFVEWRRVPVQQRQRVMLKFQQAIRDRTEDLAYLVSLENGKTLADARGDVFRGLEMVESACFVAPTLLGDSLQGISKDMDCVSFREPLGVCAGECFGRSVW